MSEVGKKNPTRLKAYNIYLAQVRSQDFEMVGGGTLYIIKTMVAKQPKYLRLVKNSANLEHFGGFLPCPPGYAPDLAYFINCLIQYLCESIFG